MRLTLFTRLFITLLLAVMTAVLLMLVFVNWTFRSGFNEFLHFEEHQKLQQLAQQLAQMYEQDGSWFPLSRQRWRWREALDQSGVTIQTPGGQPMAGGSGFAGAGPGGPEPRGSDNGGRAGQGGSGLPPASPGRSLRIALVDVQGYTVVGNPDLAHLAQMSAKRRLYEQPVTSGGQVVGYLNVLETTENTMPWADTFWRQQLQSLYWPALAAGLLAFAGAALVVRRLLRPIQHLTEGTRALRDGQWQTPVPVDGSDELALLAAEFNHLATSLTQQESLRQQWQADISHELRTPIAILRAEIEAIQDGICAPTPERIGALHRSVMMLTTLVEDLRQLSLSDAGHWDFQFAEQDLTLVLDDALYANQQRCQEQGLQLRRSYDPLQTLLVVMDGDRIYQMLTGLLTNSLRYTDAPGVVELIAFADADAAVIRIRDSAPGVSDADLPRLFDRLYRVDSSRSRELGGSGLGLAIVRAIVEAHKGSVTCDHSSLGGLQVEVRLPLVKEETGECNN